MHSERTIFKQLYQYGRQANTHDITKVIAVIAMVIDHIGWVTHQEWMRVIGRIAAPLFFFLVGYSKSYRWQNKLFIYAIALAFLHSIFLTPLVYVNILFGFIIVRLLLTWLAPVKLDRQLLLALFIGCNVVSFYSYNYVEYGALGLQIALLGLFVREQRSYAVYWGIATFAIYTFVQMIRLHFNTWPYSTSNILLQFATAWWCCNYQQRIWRLPKILTVPALYLSRYSLPIYFYHYTAIILLYFLISRFMMHR
ncbi:MAG: TraX family protein [Coxiellaceae bacterium]|nr:TraX family protein [Coxiellaceae bacterium]